MDVDAQLLTGPHDGRFHRFDAQDGKPVRLTAYKDSAGDPAAQPVWVLAEAPSSGARASWRELAFLPTIGHSEPDSWHGVVLADAAAADGSHLISYATSGRWAPLLAFLGRRDFPNGAQALDQLLGEGLVRDAVWGKIRSPLAAIAGALTAVACGAVKQSGVQVAWLENLANWFPGLADGQVILGRHLLRERQVEPARKAFRTALERGIPVYSLAVDWLAEGLQTLDPEAAKVARRWSWMSDPRRTFTVLKLKAQT